MIIKGGIALAIGVTSFAAGAADIVLTPPAGGGVSITNAGGNTTRFRVAEDGTVTLPGVTAASQPATGLCVDNATLKVGTCTSGGGTITGVTAVSPLVSSGGTAPQISLTVVPVAKGGTGSTTLPFGVLVGQGTGPLTAKLGNVGHVLVGTAQEPEFTTSPTIAGSLVLPAASSSGAGNVMKGADRFLHNFGGENTFLGVGAGNFTMTGSGNIAAGFQALAQNTSANFNAAFGAHALENNTTGGQNAALGWGAMMGNTIGANNVAIGYETLKFNASHDNVAVGAFAMKFTTGSNNVALGHSAGIQAITGSFNVAIANNGESGDSGTIRIGSANDQNRAFVAGIRGVTTGAGDALPVLIDSNGQLGTASASRQEGEFQFAGGAAGVNVKTVTFPTPFIGAVPKVIVTPKTDDFGGGPVNDTLVASVRQISTTQFQVNVFRVDMPSGAWSVNTRLAWIAWQ
jgi:hypothetical protein